MNGHTKYPKDATISIVRCTSSHVVLYYYCRYPAEITSTVSYSVCESRGSLIYHYDVLASLVFTSFNSSLGHDLSPSSSYYPILEAHIVSASFRPPAYSFGYDRATFNTGPTLGLLPIRRKRGLDTLAIRGTTPVGWTVHFSSETASTRLPTRKSCECS